jgi:YHS domain-containing protein
MTRRGFLPALCLMALCGIATTVEAQTQADTSLRLALKGYDPVAYFTDGKPTQGKPEFETVFDGARYRFASTENMDRFKADPDRYAPQFGGACAYALSKGVRVEADPTVWRIVDDKLYVFAATKVLPEVDADPRSLIAKADENNKALTK